MATAVAQYVIASLYADLERPTERRGRAVVTGVYGELHQLGANMVADILESDGWDVRFLGTNVPPDGAVRAAVDHRADLVGISAMMLPNLSRVTELVERVRAAGDDRRRVIVGGGLFRSDPHLWRQVGADGFAPDLREVVALARRVSGAEA